MRKTVVLIIIMLLVSTPAMAFMDAIRGLSKAADLYNGVRGTVAAFKIMGSVKELKGMPDTLKGYTQISIASSLIAREKETEPVTLTEAAMEDNLAYVAELHSGIIYPAISVCGMPPLDKRLNVRAAAPEPEGIFADDKETSTDAQLKYSAASNKPCGNKTVVVQFKEKVYDSFLEKLTVGDTLLGTLYYTDKQSGKILLEEEFESMATYADLLVLISGSISKKMLKASGVATEEEINRINGAYPQPMEVVLPEYKTILGEGSK